MNSLSPLFQPNLPQNKPSSPIKQIFKSSITWRCIYPSDLTYINKYKPKMLSNITITNLKSLIIRASGLQHLRRALKDSKTASSLTFSHTDLNSKQLSFLFHSTNHWKKFSLPDRDLQRFLKTASGLRRCKNLVFFPLGRQLLTNPIMHHDNAKMLQRISRQLKGLPNIKILDLNMSLSPTIRINSRLPRSVQTVRLAFEKNDTFSKQELSDFLSNLQESNQLEHLFLTFYGSYQIGPLDVRLWTSFFKNSPNSLKQLTLIFAFNPFQQLEQVKFFFESLKHLKHITSLCLVGADHLNAHSLDDFFSSLFFNLKFNVHLEKLILHLVGVPDLKDKSLKQLALTLRCLKNLKELQIHLPSLQSPDEGFVSISESLKDLTHLKIFYFTSISANLSQKSMETFAKNIAHCPLTSFSLGCENFQSISAVKSGVGKLINIFKNNTLPPFLGSIQNFTQLSYLNLQLSTFEISTQDWRQFSVALKQLKELSTLWLTLPKFDPDNNFAGLQNFLSCLQEFPKLAALNLGFKKQICNQEIGILSSHIAQCKSLTSLTLEFFQSSQLGDNSLYFLLCGIQGLLTLENLHIIFQEKESFGEKAVLDFLKGLIVLKNLSTLHFRQNVSEGQLPPDLKNFISNLRKLSSLMINNSKII